VPFESRRPDHVFFERDERARTGVQALVEVLARPVDDEAEAGPEVPGLCVRLLY
jgi:hypothetical protein